MTDRFNWWKLAFFVALIAFELTREYAVIQAYEPPKRAALADVNKFGQFVMAQGQWKRMDKGAPLSDPPLIKIECDSEKRSCVMASVGVSDYVSVPDINTFDATFTDQAVIFNDTFPTCVDYHYRIDLQLKKMIAVRERKAKVDPARSAGVDCSIMEPRIELTLANSSDDLRDTTKGHFIPLMRVVMWVLRQKNA